MGEEVGEECSLSLLDLRGPLEKGNPKTTVHQGMDLLREVVNLRGRSSEIFVFVVLFSNLSHWVGEEDEMKSTSTHYSIRGWGTTKYVLGD